MQNVNYMAYDLPPPYSAEYSPNAGNNPSAPPETIPRNFQIRQGNNQQTGLASYPPKSVGVLSTISVLVKLVLALIAIGVIAAIVFAVVYFVVISRLFSSKSIKQNAFLIGNFLERQQLAIKSRIQIRPKIILLTYRLCQQMPHCATTVTFTMVQVVFVCILFFKSNYLVLDCF
jgi:hypothetical protein